MIMVVCLHCPWYVPECCTPHCKERSIPQGGMIMVVRVVYCRWYVSWFSPLGMFLVLYSGTNHMQNPLLHFVISKTGAYLPNT